MNETSKPSLTETIAASVPNRGIRLAYGDVESVGSASVLPVAIVSYGFGASDDSQQWGVGGGGGGAVIPIGAYVESGGELRFRPNTIAVLAMLIPLAGVVGSVLVKLARR